jgi:hypothetical protein
LVTTTPANTEKGEEGREMMKWVKRKSKKKTAIKEGCQYVEK